MRFPTIWYVRPAKPQISLNKLLTVLHFEFLSLKGGCTGSHESTPVKMPHCWKSYVMAHIHIEMFTSCLYIFNLSRKSLIVLRNNFSACDVLDNYSSRL